MTSLLGGFSKALDVVKSDLNEFVSTVQEEASQQISAAAEAGGTGAGAGAAGAGPADGEGTGARESALGAPPRSTSVLDGIDVEVDDNTSTLTHTSTSSSPSPLM